MTPPLDAGPTITQQLTTHHRPERRYDSHHTPDPSTGTGWKGTRTT
ncbi:hypothetical protein SAMN06295974_2644 [Plantibacter flavus]|uniref:Uncharacterized protein n=1 Tax=Plantibacter flavus TaxID=150123 RepID=A0A3N2C4V2_9MICO|nr:hypothetical protein EDD42_2642 [Plantibacter flavus]SMG38140.1 hypothetical protein SAMN06295974_2644 [Plantibacter flavus]